MQYKLVFPCCFVVAFGLPPASHAGLRKLITKALENAKRDAKLSERPKVPEDVVHRAPAIINAYLDAKAYLDTSDTKALLEISPVVTIKREPDIYFLHPRPSTNHLEGFRAQDHHQRYILENEEDLLLFVSRYPDALVDLGPRTELALKYAVRDLRKQGKWVADVPLQSPAGMNREQVLDEARRIEQEILSPELTRFVSDPVFAGYSSEKYIDLYEADGAVVGKVRSLGLYTGDPNRPRLLYRDGFGTMEKIYAKDVAKFVKNYPQLANLVTKEKVLEALEPMYADLNRKLPVNVAPHDLPNELREVREEVEKRADGLFQKTEKLLGDLGDLGLGEPVYIWNGWRGTQIILEDRATPRVDEKGAAPNSGPPLVLRLRRRTAPVLSFRFLREAVADFVPFSSKALKKEFLDDFELGRSLERNVENDLFHKVREFLHGESQKLMSELAWFGATDMIQELSKTPKATTSFPSGDYPSDVQAVRRWAETRTNAKRILDEKRAHAFVNTDQAVALMKHPRFVEALAHSNGNATGGTGNRVHVLHEDDTRRVVLKSFWPMNDGLQIYLKRTNKMSAWHLKAQNGHLILPVFAESEIVAAGGLDPTWIKNFVGRELGIPTRMATRVATGNTLQK